MANETSPRAYTTIAATARGRESSAFRADDGVPALLDRLDPLRLVPEGDARHAEEVRLLLDATGIRRDLLRLHQEGEEVEVVDRVDRGDLSPKGLPQPEGLQVLPVPGGEGECDGTPAPHEGVDDPPER